MKRIKLWGTFLAIFLSLSFLSGSVVQAQVATFDSLHLDLTYPDGTTCLTPSTNSQDPAWAAAGITDVSKEKKEFSKMGGQAYFYDSNTNTLVRLLVKTSSQSQDIFNLSLLTEDERHEFLNTMTSSSDENAKFEIEDYMQGELPFFRLSIQVTGTSSQQEIIYGTIVNGSMIYYDVYTEQGNTTIDESLQQSLVSGTHFTKIYTKEEYDALRQKSFIRLVVTFVSIILVIVILVIVSKKNQKKKAIDKKKKADMLYNYYAAKKEKENADIKQKLLFENRTTYSQNVIKQFCYYTSFLKKLPIWAVTAVLYLMLLVFLYNTSGLSLQLLIVVAAMIAVICYQCYKVDKFCNYLWKPYSDSANKEADIRFYEDHFTVSGVQYVSEYPYLQITSISRHKEFIYLYLGTDQAIYLSKDGFTSGTAEDCIACIKGYLVKSNKNA